MQNSNLGCVIMASGLSKRFGENKLLTLLDGKPMISYVLDSIPDSLKEETVVVTQYEEIQKMAKNYGYHTIHNPHPELGQTQSVIIGTDYHKEKDGILFCVADQPKTKKNSIQSLIDTFLLNPQKIIAPAFQGKRGNPCIFPKSLFTELLKLEGDRGGSQVIKNHLDQLILVEVSEEELLDIDQKEELKSF